MYLFRVVYQGILSYIQIALHLHSKNIEARNMRATIGNNLIVKLKPTGKQYDVRDAKLVGFLIRVNPTGKMSYVCEYKRGKRINLGKVGILTPAQARDKAKEILGDATKGIYPGKKTSEDVINFKDFIRKEYGPWFRTNRKSSKQTMFGLEQHFIKNFGDLSLLEFTPLLIDKWRSKMLEANKKAATANRYIDSLKAALSKAVEWGFIPFNAIAKLKPVKIDVITRARFLDEGEDYRLREALDERENQIKYARCQANQWRKQRGYTELPNLQKQYFVDHLKPMVILSKNTGIRRNELFSIDRERDVNLQLKILTIRDSNAKSGKTRHIPLNEEALHVIKKWIEQTASLEFLFSNKDGNKFTDIKKSWAAVLKSAKIKNFRWHDLRHDFASKLIMAGVDLNTVRELLGHSDIRMTLRYAHLAPEHKANAVAKLIQERAK